MLVLHELELALGTTEFNTIPAEGIGSIFCKVLYSVMPKFMKLKNKDLLKEININIQNRKIGKKINHNAMILHFGKCWTFIMLLLLLLLLLLVFSPWAGLGRDQSSVVRLVWLWYAASWASS